MLSKVEWWGLLKVFFMVLNSSVIKQGHSGKARNKRGEDSKSDCDLAQLGTGKEATKPATDVFSV